MRLIAGKYGSFPIYSISVCMIRTINIALCFALEQDI